jgi:hypothetical protein
MNKLITNKITLTLIFVILCHFTVNAQDDSSKKVIVVVRPGHATQAAAASTTKYASKTPSITNKPATTKPALLASNNKATAAAPGTQVNTAAGAQKSATVLASTTQKTPAVMASTATTKATTAAVVAATKKPAAPYVAPGSRIHTYNAPSTAERTGVASYMHPVVTPSKQGAPVITAAVVPVSATGNAVGGATGNAVSGATGNTSKYAAAPAAPHQAVITTTVPAVKRDTIVITKLKHDTVDTMPAKHRGNKILFAEIGGPGIAISINYDARFKSGQKDGFGYRVGIGYFAAGNNTVFTIPVQVNYLYGKDGKYLELGIGTTFINSRGDNYSSPTWEFDTVTGLAATAVIGVRYEPNKALNFRLGYVPIVSSYGLINAGGFSVGYTF